MLDSTGTLGHFKSGVGVDVSVGDFKSGIRLTMNAKQTNISYVGAPL